MYSKFRMTPVLGAMLLVISGAAAEAQTQTTSSFDLPEQSLIDSLKAIASQTHQNVFFEPKLVAGRKAPALKGQVSTAEALRRLLAGTGLTYRKVDDKTYTIVSAGSPDAAISAPLSSQSGESSSKNSSMVNLALFGNDPAQLAQAASSELADKSVAAADKAGAKKNGEAVEEMIVEDTKIKPFSDANVDIPRTINDPQPYYIFDSETITRSGAINVGDFLKQRLTMNAVAVTNSQYTAGIGIDVGNSSTVNLRGLGSDKTLVLINGRRIAGPVGISSADVMRQADLNGIPMSAIDRIEVLPSSASGIYGGSALGGVINVILKKNYSGSEIHAAYDNTVNGSSPSRTVGASYATGLNGGKTQLSLNAQWSDAEALAVRDRSDLFYRGIAAILRNSPSFVYSNSQPFLGALPNITSSSYFLAGVSTPDPGVLTLKNGTSLNARSTYIPAGTTTGTPLNVLNAGLLANAGSYNLDLPNTAQSPTGLYRRLAPDQSNKSFMATLRQEVRPNVNLELEVARRESRSITTHSIFPTSFVVPSTNVNNPFTSAIRISMPSTVVQPYDVKSIVDSATLGASIGLGAGWTVQADYTKSISTTYHSYNESLDGNLTGTDFAAALSFNPFVDVLASPPAAFSNFMRYTSHNDNRLATSVDTFAIRGSGSLLALPWGVPSLTAGLEHRAAKRHENTLDVTRPLSTSFVQVNFAQEQAVSSAYMETLIPLAKKNWLPLVHSLELQLSGRSERVIQDAGTRGMGVFANGTVSYLGITRNGQAYFTQASYTSSNHTIGMKYQPIQELTLRASIGTAFLPPTPEQLYKNPLPDTNPSTVTDPRNNNLPVLVGTVSGGNPDLMPQTGRSSNAGLIWQPSWDVLKDLRFNAEYYRIEQYDAIGNLSAQLLVNNESAYRDRVTRNAAGVITFIDTSMVNLYKRDTQGWDLSVDYMLRTRAGTFGIRAAESIIIDLKNQYSLTLPEYDAVNFPSDGGAGKYKSNLQLTWDYRNWTVSWAARYFSSYKQYGAEGGPSATQRRATNPSATLEMYYLNPQGGDTIPSQTYHDLFIGHTFAKTRDSGASAAPLASRMLSGVSFQAGVRNVFNTLPPFDVNFPFYISAYGDVRLRSYWFNVTKEF